MATPLTLSDFDYALPRELIAQHPAAERSAARLLDGVSDPPRDCHVRDLPALLRPGDLLVVNDTAVVKARLFGVKASGGVVEALVERLEDGVCGVVVAQLRASKSPREGTLIRFADAFDAEVLGRGGSDGSLFRLRFPGDPLALLERYGRVPLPPYIDRADDADDRARYQTVFAERPGAVAAPTAALHFDAELLAALAARGVERTAVTLHVGAGTFRPVRSENIAEHVMHSERFEVGAAAAAAIVRARAAGGRIVAVGTTSLRALESAALRRAAGEPFAAAAGETDLFVTPGFGFRVVELLLTNFHLPRSTLLMLVSAFAGRERIRALYAHAIEERYRFFSYGDAMLLARGGGPGEPAA
ncbi:MAG TPA: tRNA preQ1(34) S-adenosylmethionine ribosyltransferase-isomerase QueA [Caldimonas sp.]|jgi:S-adenosylmethionine:tRNA ribosyltransferase-isomerase|nr:tRNA preQ1(34) S-adenosylmethionine ribosyltransferase-isomerase QueA [Caldimonas sp.]HEX4233490.1 tRNA preQ1(34) S-adenosylmethionine ribosyltransferase-isomerase QueA [Caldimonas sp.]